ncbi:hypothetical protein ACOSP7_027389 [Xanthoceras sorbifolium]
MDPSEKSGGHPRSALLINNFREALADCSLEWLDRGVCSLEWFDLFLGSSITHLDFWKSNHRPLLISILSDDTGNGQPCREARRFHFKECWYNEKECGLIVDRHLGGGGVR